jgi:hypothetical protein
VDVTGVWLGQFTPQGGSSGTVILDLTQTGASVTGGAGLFGAAVPDGNAGVWVYGTVSGSQLALQVKGSADQFQATVTAGTLAGAISSSVSTTWTATQVSTSSLVLGTSQPAEFWDSLLAYQGGALWYVNTGHINGAPFADSINATYCGVGFDRCGDGFICSQQGGAIFRVAKGDPYWTATQLTSVAKTTTITCDATSIWASRFDLGAPDGMNLIQHLDSSGAPLGVGFYLPGILVGMTFDGTDLWVLESYPPVLLRISTSTEQVLAAYQVAAALPPPGPASGMTLMKGLTWDGSSLWTLFESDDPNTHVASTVAVQLLAP